MDDGILLLRLLLGALMAGHALQKLCGWYGGMGIGGTATLFEGWGLRPGRLMVILAATTELVGAVLIAAGALMALAVACIVGTMTVAVWVSRGNGLWAVRGGYELPLVYAVVGLGLGLAGPGRFSLDHAAGLADYATDALVLAAAALALVGSAPLVLRISRTRAGADPSVPTASARP